MPTPSDVSGTPMVFEYEGPAEAFCQEGGYAAPGMRLGEPEGGVGFFTQMTNRDTDLVSQVAAMVSGEHFDTLNLGRVRVRIEILGEVTPA